MFVDKLWYCVTDLLRGAITYLLYVRKLFTGGFAISVQLQVLRADVCQVAADHGVSLGDTEGLLHVFGSGGVGVLEASMFLNVLIMGAARSVRTTIVCLKDVLPSRCAIHIFHKGTGDGGTFRPSLAEKTR